MPNDTAITVHVHIDASGLNCPLPILKAKKALHDLQNGQVLCLISTDSGSRREFEMFAHQTQHHLLAVREEDDKTYFYMQKG